MNKSRIKKYYLDEFNEVSSAMSSNTYSVSLEILLEQIETARHRMQQLWNAKGFTDAEVLYASIEVDRLLNEYERAIRFLGQEQKKFLARGEDS